MLINMHMYVSTRTYTLTNTHILTYITYIICVDLHAYIENGKTEMDGKMEIKGGGAGKK